MSVILEGMEMPESCTKCFMLRNCNLRVPADGINNDCPLRPAPEWIGLVLSKYDENREKPWIRDPVAYTLYEVWKIMDSKVSYRPSERGDGDG